MGNSSYTILQYRCVLRTTIEIRLEFRYLPGYPFEFKKLSDAHKSFIQTIVCAFTQWKIRQFETTNYFFSYISENKEGFLHLLYKVSETFLRGIYHNRDLSSTCFFSTLTYIVWTFEAYFVLPMECFVNAKRSIVQWNSLLTYLHTKTCTCTFK